MIDTSKLMQDWGYGGMFPQHGQSPGGAPPGWPGTHTGGTPPATGGSGPQASIPTQVGNQPLSAGQGAEMANIQYPEQWKQAGDVWSQMASGGYSNTGLDWMKDWLGGGGAQGMMGDWSDAYRKSMMGDYSNMVKQMAEQAGVGGVRYGSGLQQSIGNYGGQMMNRYNADLMNQMMNAAGMDVGTAQGLGGMQAGIAGTGAEGLLSLGQNYANLPLQVAGSLAGIGGAMSGDQANWANMLQQALTGTYNQPQSWYPSGWDQMFGTLANVPWGDIFGGGGGGGGGGGQHPPATWGID